MIRQGNDSKQHYLSISRRTLSCRGNLHRGWSQADIGWQVYDSLAS